MNKKQFLKDTIKKAGDMALAKYRNFDRGDIKLKKDSEIVTEVDLASEKIIISAIKKNFPDHHIISEEAGENKNQSDYAWIIDPIDGTTNFSIHNPLWSVSIALAYKNKLILSAVYAPVLDELFIAEAGKGATLNNKKIKVSNRKEGKVINTFCHGSRKQDKERAVKYYSVQKFRGIDCRQLGSAALELCYTAVGRIESIVIPGANAYDVAGGVLILQEAGGKITDFEGNKWEVGSPDMAGSNSRIHKDILSVLKKI